MSATDLQKRLTDAQHAVLEALADNQPQEVPALLSAREADLRTLATRIEQDPQSALVDWSRKYLERDAELLEMAEQARGLARRRLSDMHRTLSVARSYLSTGLRR